MPKTAPAPVDVIASAVAAATGDNRWNSLDMNLVTGGKSNLTYFLESAAGTLVLRRPPTGDLLPSAHDMLREARVQSALAASDVPVPRIVLVDSGDLLGVPCYVMERVAGHVVRDHLPVGWADDAESRRAVAFGFVDTLADLHAVDHEAVGLGDYGRPSGFATRQVRRWTGQWEASRSQDVPEIDLLAQRLAESVPVQQRSTLVHGDYRLDNVVLDASTPGTINAVLDWELSTLGDPMTDVALLDLFWNGPADRPLSLIPGVSHLPGFPSREEMLQRYSARSGAALDDLDWYRAFAHFKFAVITQGVSARSRAGDMAGQDFGDLDAEVLHLGRTGLALL
ncbi:phosphotransferase family protein [Nocardioides yefusunii]|uniref:Phosphotransferase family protein n=1 Tax=Nocardioides yefusunii TaxID=2500546 RepID=A0ABW1QWS0_9ACTN|nr:phosphotransferase family protein [Nocardioides yefusunii]